MIQAIFGLPRTGKSTYLTKLAIKALKSGMYCGEPIERVYTNFAVNYEGIFELQWDKLGVEDYSNCLILIDEISLYCDNRNWKDNLNKNLLYFWKLYGHYKCQIVYCSQSFMDCDKKIRDLTDELYMITRLPFVPVSRIRRISKVMGVSNGSVQEYYDTKGLGSFVYRPAYYKYFDSYECKKLLPNTSKTWISPHNAQNALECPSNSGSIITLPTPLEREKTLIDTCKSNKTIKIYKK